MDGHKEERKLVVKVAECPMNGKPIIREYSTVNTNLDGYNITCPNISINPKKGFVDLAGYKTNGDKEGMNTLFVERMDLVTGKLIYHKEFSFPELNDKMGNNERFSSFMKRASTFMRFAPYDIFFDYDLVNDLTTLIIEVEVGGMSRNHVWYFNISLNSNADIKKIEELYFYPPPYHYKNYNTAYKSHIADDYKNYTARDESYTVIPRTYKLLYADQTKFIETPYQYIWKQAGTVEPEDLLWKVVDKGNYFSMISINEKTSEIKSFKAQIK